MTLRDALITATRLLGRTLPDAAAEAGVAPRELRRALDGADMLARVLAPLGLRLAVVRTDADPVQVPDGAVLAAAEALHLERGERGVRARLARLLGRSEAAITRAADHGAELTPEARERLRQHMLDPDAHPLPEYQRPGPRARVD